MRFPFCNAIVAARDRVAKLEIWERRRDGELWRAMENYGVMELERGTIELQSDKSSAAR